MAGWGYNGISNVFSAFFGLNYRLKKGEKS